MVDNPYKYPYVPIGGIIEWDGTGLTGAPDLSTPEKVAAVYGYGTWERYGTDRVTVGAGGEYAAGSTGGEEKHTLTALEMPKHAHRQNGQTSDGDTNGTVNTKKPGNLYGSYSVFGYESNTRSEPINTGYLGGDQPHNNMQPYVGTYRYRRIA